ncbi:Transcriptional regulatory protein AfsQ1 [Streptomyces microflavus]
MPRVLLVEDDPSVREGVELGLRRCGHDVLAAATGEAGLEALCAFRPDLLLLDLMLPAMDGVQVCCRVRENSQLPIIMLTALGDDVDIVVGLDAGADDYIVKPARHRGHRGPHTCRAARHRSPERREARPSSTTVDSTSTVPATPSAGRATRSPSPPPN